MDWLRKIPIGQYVAGNSGWLHSLDPRLKLGWVLMFLLSPVLAGLAWRASLVAGLLLMTLLSRLPLRVWWRSACFLITFSILVGAFAMLLPTGEVSASFPIRSPQELSHALLSQPSWEVVKLGPAKVFHFDLGPLVINRRSAQLGLKTFTLIFTVVHSVNLMLLTTAPEDLMWTLRWFMSPLSWLGLPIDRISFQLLLSLRFLPLIQEEFQNLLRSLSTRAVNVRRLGFKASFGLVLSVGERLLANILLRADQGADALLARGGSLPLPEEFRPRTLLKNRSSLLDIGAGFLLVMVLCLRGKYGAL